MHDQAEVEAYQHAQAQNSEIDRLAAQYDIPTRGLTQAEFFDRLADRVSLEDAAREAKEAADAHDALYAQAEQAAKDWVAWTRDPNQAILDWEGNITEVFDTTEPFTGEGAFPLVRSKENERLKAQVAAVIGDLEQETAKRVKVEDEYAQLDKRRDEFEDSLRSALGDELLAQIVDAEIGFVPEDIPRGILFLQMTVAKLGATVKRLSAPVSEKE
jgi:hypothetical protein